VRRAPRHRLAPLIVVTATLALSACAGAETTPNGTAHARMQLLPASAHAPLSALPQATLPDGTRHLIPEHRLVAFYGAAGTPQLGVLGTGSPDEVWPRLRRQAKAYDRTRVPVLPTYELIAYVATSSAGPDGDYASRVPDHTIHRYAAAARRHHALLVLDIQPGRGSFLADAKSLERWLVKPQVALALDPEWQLGPHERPLQQIGHTDGRTVNRVSRWLGELTRVNDLPQKLLLIHQFTTDMVRHKGLVRARKHLALVFNMDGFGSREAKIGNYQRMAQDKRFPLGIKLFYKQDSNLLTPRRVLHLKPRPSVVEYQ
jgi:hypothetical protein